MRYLIVLLLVGCATTPVPSLVELSDGSELPDGCESLGAVAASSGGFDFGDKLQNARDRVMIESDRRGATHIVWKNLQTTYGGASASGVAYRCGS